MTERSWLASRDNDIGRDTGRMGVRLLYNVTAEGIRGVALAILKWKEKKRCLSWRTKRS